MMTEDAVVHTGAITAETLEKIQAWFKAKNVVLVCPVCKQHEFGVFGHITSANIYSGGNLLIGGPSYPLVQLGCNNCGHVLAFSAVRLGISK